MEEVSIFEIKKSDCRTNCRYCNGGDKEIYDVYIQISPREHYIVPLCEEDILKLQEAVNKGIKNFYIDKSKWLDEELTQKQEELTQKQKETELEKKRIEEKLKSLSE